MLIDSSGREIFFN